MTHYALLVGAGGWFPMSASGGTESTEDIGGVDYRVRKFTYIHEEEALTVVAVEVELMLELYHYL